MRKIINSVRTRCRGVLTFVGHQKQIARAPHLAYVLSFLVLSSCLCPPHQALAQADCLTPTPSMGWNAWNIFQGDIDEQKIKAIADAMVSSGMKEADYEYVVIDDLWHQGRIAGGWNNHPQDIVGRDENGRLIPDPVKFPSGMKALSDYIHSRGLKFGIYTAPGRKTCAYAPGSEGYEATDVQTFVEWGVDFIKLDWCDWITDDYQTVLNRWRGLLDAAGRPIVLSVNSHRGDDFSLHRTVANMYRTTTDIRRVWQYPPEEFRVQASVLDIIDRQEGLEEYHGNCHWNDPDMLQVGNEPFTDEENQSHFSMWAIFGAPLIAGNDLRTMSEATTRILTNREVIAVAQDPAGIKGVKVAEPQPGLEVYAKRLQAVGTQAVALLNRTDQEASITVKWKDLGIQNQAFVRDLWQHQDQGLFENKYATQVPAHGTVVLLVEATEFLGPLPDFRLKPADVPEAGLVVECEGRSSHWETGRIDDSLQNYSGTGYLISQNHVWSPFMPVWRLNLAKGGAYQLTFRYRNLTAQAMTYTCSKADQPVVLQPGNDWQEITVVGTLKPGINWIKVTAPDSQSNEAAFDCMRLSRVRPTR